MYTDTNKTKLYNMTLHYRTYKSNTEHYNKAIHYKMITSTQYTLDPIVPCPPVHLDSHLYMSGIIYHSYYIPIIISSTYIQCQ